MGRNQIFIHVFVLISRYVAAAIFRKLYFGYKIISKFKLLIWITFLLFILSWLKP